MSEEKNKKRLVKEVVIRYYESFDGENNQRRINKVTESKVWFDNPSPRLNPLRTSTSEYI